MKLLVCGGRDFGDQELFDKTLKRLTSKFRFTTIIHGGARGADHLAGVYAHKQNLRCIVFQANWAKDGRGAGPKRNARMLVEGKPDFVVAFPGGRGTADMVRRSKEAGLPVLVVTP